MLRFRSVRMKPGAMQFTWMLYLPHSAASTMVNCPSAPLVMAYMERYGTPSSDIRLPIVITFPPAPRAIIFAPTFCVNSTRP